MLFVLNKKSITVEDQDTYLDEDYQERKAVVVMGVAYILHEDNLLGKVEEGDLGCIGIRGIGRAVGRTLGCDGGRKPGGGMGRAPD